MENQFQSKLINLRKENAMSQETLSEKLFVSRQTISKWETGETTPDLDNLIKLASLFNISLDELVFDEEFPSKNQREILYNESQKTNWADIFNRFWWLIFPIGGGIITVIQIIFNR